MAKKNEAPIITYTEILAMAGKAIQGEILKLRREAQELAEKAGTAEERKLLAQLDSMTKNQEAYHMRRLEAVETMYQIQTGVALGLIDELQEEG